MTMTGRNRPCPCGSEKKYKKCCGASEAVARGGALKPRFAPGDERDPAYWRVLPATPRTGCEPLKPSATAPRRRSRASPSIRCTCELEAERDRAEATIALSLAHDAELHVDGLGGELRPFQCAAVRYALAQRRTFLADEQGLGKTVEALATLHADEAFPAVVVCPASMKLVWQRECERWIPGRRVAVVHGRSADGWASSGAGRADVVLCNYDILEAHTERLAARGLRAAVSTSRTTARTRAASGRRPRSGLRRASPPAACASRSPARRSSTSPRTSWRSYG